MENLGYYNGKFGLLEEMTVPFNDRVHFFGDGVYEAAPARNGVIFALDEHLDRLFRSAAMLDIKIPHSREEIRDILCEMVKKVDGKEHFVYWQVTRGTHVRNHVYPEDMTGNLWISIKQAPPKEVGRRVRAITAEDTRFFHCHIKTLNLIPAVMYAQMAERAGVYETILYRAPDRVTECAHSNVHIIDEKGAFRTAPLDNLILPGIARMHLIRACRALGYEVDETPFTVEEMMNAKEVMISSSSAPGLVCTEIDGKPVGGKAPEMLESILAWVKDEFDTATLAN